MIGQIAAFGYVLCALAYVLVGALLVVGRGSHRYKALLLTGAAATAAWAGAAAAAHFAAIPSVLNELAVVLLELLRNVAWIATLGYVLSVAYRKRFDPVMEGVLAIAGIGAIAYIVATGIAAAAGHELSLEDIRIGYIARIVLAVIGLLLVENLFRNSGEQSRWAIKYLCFAAGAAFALDFLLYAEAALYGAVNQSLSGARGIVNAIVAPLVVVAAARSKSWPIDLHVSRRLVFHSATLIAAGAYLVVMAGVAQSLLALDSQWGGVLQTSFIVVAVLALATALSSGSARTRIKNFIDRNFFSYKYDYRREWLNFIGAISDSLDELSVPARIVRAMANLMESTAGALWIYREEDNAFIRAESWNIATALPSLSPSDPLVAALSESKGTIDIEAREIDGRKEMGLVMPDWLTGNAKAWLLVALIHRSDLIGILLLGPPRARRRLDWEDFDLLRTAGRQAASYLAEESAARSLARARRFEDFNRQFAFVIHDIKNLAGQMSLILKNAERHGHNPEFQSDVLATVADSFARMQAMLKQLHHRRPTQTVKVELSGFLRDLAVRWQLQAPALRFDLPNRAVDVLADVDSLSAVFNHLIQNAVDASAAGTEVTVTLAAPHLIDSADGATGWAEVTVTDRGAGMDEEFVRERLFQPMDSSKADGFGIGAYQTQRLVREMGGRLEVDSKLGVGTTVAVRLQMIASGAVGGTSID